MKHDFIIGIDPDITKSGVSFLEVKTRKLEVSSLTFPQLLDYLKFIREKHSQTPEKLIVVVEAGWLVQKSNYHGYAGGRAEKIAKNVGANHETGKKIVEMCKHYGLEVQEIRPLKKMWKGKDGKITHEELASFTGITGKTNQDSRDAGLLAWCFANLPIKITSQ
ncbi:hypothetical protein CAPN001_11470 [Capnocytophaga stomatis]|uniref:hypothetical protein n=1 Tax=Capnocytophaga stomatis TaxID=1848904 RepID=UPI00194E1395|nr:hypothetical protein [Capnocytophaga stomatis]GIJ96578.1 hypothetical protein CAPN001_11470 [Capnocytophaga stomatis]